jgi:hypothetical protein
MFNKREDVKMLVLLIEAAFLLASGVVAAPFSKPACT